MRTSALALVGLAYLGVAGIFFAHRIQRQQRSMSQAEAADDGGRRGRKLVDLQGIPLAAAMAGRPFHRRSPWARSYTSVQWCKGPPRLLAPPGPVTALASFPGSGNTWLRYLIQQATGKTGRMRTCPSCWPKLYAGLATGSVYKDYALMKNGFPGESVRNGSVVAVKTHEFGPDAAAPFARVILLVRDPCASLRAEFNRRSGGHVGHASAEKYRRNGGRNWRQFVAAEAERWQRFHEAWRERFPGGNMMVLRYEDLVDDVAGQLRRVLHFLGRNGDEEALKCTVQRREGIYQRPHRPLGFQPFDAAMLADMRRRMDVVYPSLGLQAPQSASKAPTTQTKQPLQNS